MSRRVNGSHQADKGKKGIPGCRNNLYEGTEALKEAMKSLVGLELGLFMGSRGQRQETAGWTFKLESDWEGPL